MSAYLPDPRVGRGLKILNAIQSVFTPCGRTVDPQGYIVSDSGDIVGNHIFAGTLYGRPIRL